MRISIIAIIQELVIAENSQYFPDFIPLARVHGSPDLGKFAPCELPRGSGLMAGLCVDTGYLAESLSFCKEFILSPSCVPPDNPLWPTWTAAAKDALIGSVVEEKIASRLAQEDETLSKVPNANFTSVFFTGNHDCVQNFKKISCLINFPSCDAKRSVSFPICPSECLEYFTACRFDPSYSASACSAADSIWPFDSNSNSSLNLTRSHVNDVCTGNSAQNSRGEIYWAMLLISFHVLLNGLVN